MNKEIKKHWVSALAQYRQGYRSLRTPDGFCCLGVLCDLHNVLTTGLSGDNWRTEPWRSSSSKHSIEPTSYTYFGESSTLPPVVMAWAGLSAINPVVVVNGKTVTLAQCNDGVNTRRLSFEEIAKLIDEQL